MLRKAIRLILVLILIPLFAFAETIDVQIKGVDDGVKTTKQAKHGNIIGRDGDFILHRTGIVFDKKANLEWYAGPDMYTNWNKAKKWVENLTVAGGGWRMPTRKELKTLYKEGVGESKWPLLKTIEWWVWSGDYSSSSSAWSFDFRRGRESWSRRSPSYGARGFAVRSRRYDG